MRSIVSLPSEQTGQTQGERVAVFQTRQCLLAALPERGGGQVLFFVGSWPGLS